MQQNLYISIVRTAVPLFVGSVLSILASHGIEQVDDNLANSLSEVLTFGLGLIYYVVVRLVSKKYPKLEWLLGSPVKPTYKKS